MFYEGSSVIQRLNCYTQAVSVIYRLQCVLQRLECHTQAPIVTQRLGIFYRGSGVMYRLQCHTVALRTLYPMGYITICHIKACISYKGSMSYTGLSLVIFRLKTLH